MKITVVTVSYNAESCIERTIRSVLSQTWGDLEYIVIDGGSKDRTPEIIRRYSDRLAYWCSERDGGIYFGMNKGIEAASGDYTLFLNADDTFVDEKVVERIALFLEGAHGVESIACAGDGSGATCTDGTSGGVTSLADVTDGTSGGVTSLADVADGTSGGVTSLADVADGTSGGVTSLADVTDGTSGGVTSLADVAYGDFYYEYDYGRFLRHPKPIEMMACSMAVCHQATLVKTTLLKQRPFDTQYRLSADFDMLSDLYLQRKKFVYMPFPVANMVMGSGMTHDNEEKSVAEFRAIMASHGQPLSAGQKGLLGRKKFIEWLKRVLPDKFRKPLFRFIAKLYKPL